MFLKIVKKIRYSVRLQVLSLNPFIIFWYGYYFSNTWQWLVSYFSLIFWRVLDLTLFPKYVPIDQISIMLGDIFFCSGQVFFRYNQKNPFLHEFHNHLLVGIMTIIFKSRYWNSPIFGHLTVFFHIHYELVQFQNTESVELFGTILGV